MRHKNIQPARLKRTSPAKLAGRVKSRIAGHQNMPTTEKWRHSWLKFYKLLACVAFCAIAMPYFEILVRFGAGQYAEIFTWIASALLFAVGYGIHKCIRFLFFKGDEEEFSFSFETKWQFSPPAVMIPSLVLGAAVAVGFSFVSGQILESLLYPFYNAEVGFPLLMIACVVASVLGSLLVPLQFHQLCSLRTLIECLFAFGVPFGIATWWGNGVNGLFVFCVLAYSLCLFVLMNQEYVIKPAYSSKTCYATRELRLHGMGRAAALWLTTLLTSVVILSLLAVLIIPIRFLLTPDMSLVLDFPVKGVPGINLALFFVGLIIIPTLSVLAILRFLRPRGLKYWEKILRDFFGKVIGFFLRLRFKRGARENEEMEFQEVVGERPKKQHYVDTVTATKRTEKELPTGYRVFVKQMKALPDINAQYRYAYEVLITELYHAHIGIAKHHTPLEMAEVIRRKTNIGEMDRLTAIFTAVTYAKDQVATPQNVEDVCVILQQRMKA